MSASSVYRPHLEQPATTTLSPFDAQGAWSGLRGHHFEVVSRGDFVPGSLFLPASPPGPTPLVLVQHGAGGSRQSPYLECAARWVRDGLGVALIDLPLHGPRSSPKLSERLITSVDRVAHGEELDPESAVLLEEFARQSTSDLVRTIDALAACDEIDAQRIGFVGFSLGAIIGTYLLAHDTRPIVAVLALAGGGRGPSELDPVTHIAATSSRPLLFIAAEDDARVEPESARMLFDAANEPKEFLSVAGDHGGLPGKALARIQSLTEGLEAT